MLRSLNRNEDYADDYTEISEKVRNLESDESSPYYNGLDEYFFRALTQNKNAPRTLINGR